MDGYKDRNELPDYRIKRVESLGTFVSRTMWASDIPIPISALPEWLREEASTIWIFEGIRAIEELANSKQPISANWPAEWLNVLNQKNMTSLTSPECVQGKRLISSYVFAQILDTVRSRLQDFILEISNLPWSMGKERLLAEQIQHIVEVTIFNNPQGGSMSVFDQRGQSVSNQYNAAGDINFGDAEIATDAEYHITKAVQQAKKPEPDKKAILDHLATAKAAIEGVAAASGMITALVKAAEVVSKFF
jgi:hypothetical protein